MADAVIAVHNDESYGREATIQVLKSSTGSGIGFGYNTFNSETGVTSGNNAVTITIEFNNYTYTLNKPAVGSSGTTTSGFQLLSGSTVEFKNGKIDVAASGSNIYRMFQNYANLTLENMEIDGTNQSYYKDYLIALNCGTNKIIGNTSIYSNASSVKPESTVLVALADWADGGYHGANLTIDTTGEIKGVVEVEIKEVADTCASDFTFVKGTVGGVSIIGGGVYDLSKINTDKLTITGGTFSTKPADASVPDICTVKENENGTFTVGKKTEAELIETGYVAKDSKNKYYKSLTDGFANTSALHLVTDCKQDATKNNGIIDLYCENSTFTGSLSCPGKALYIDNGIAILNRVECTTFYGGYSTYNATVTVKDGTATAINVAKNANVIIEGGTYTGKITKKEGGTGSLTITGGTFTVGTADELTNLLSYLGENANATIELANDVELSSTLTLDKNLTIDLNGHDITATDCRALLIKSGEVLLTGTGTVSATTSNKDSSVIRLGDDSSEGTAKLTVDENVKVSSTTSYGITIFGSKTTETLILNGTVETQERAGIAGNGSSGYGGTEITVNGAVTLKPSTTRGENVNAIYHPQSGSLEINGTVEGGIEAKAGTVTINSGADVKAENITADHTAYSNGCSTSGYAIAAVNNKAYSGEPTITINGGAVTGGIVLVDDDADATNNKASISITGGTFSTNPDSKYLAENKIVKRNGAAEPYTYTVLAKSGLTSGTYLSDPTGALANRYYISSTANGVWVVSYDAPSGGGSSTPKTETTTNADGSKTTTTTDTKTGAVTETTTKTETAANGTKTETKVEVVTQKDGTVTEKQTETATAKNGTTATKVETTDAAGKTETKVEAKVTAAAVTEAKTADKPVTIPVTVESTKSAETAATVSVSVPKSAGSTKVEVPVTNVTAGTVAVLVKADGTEEIIKTSVLTEDGVALKVEGDVQIKIIDNTKEFTDVVDNHWAGDAIDFATSHEIFNGTGDKSFAPEATMTRAMLFTVLARFDDAPVVTTGENWYAGSMEWAKTNGVSDGTNPEASISREQLATMLYRYAGAPAVTGDLAAFGDAATVSDYAAAAMQWAVSVGLINGIGGNLEPQGFATRAQLAAIMQRFCTNVAF